MSENNYADLLKSARAQLPKQVFETKRLEIPKLQSMVTGNRTIIKNFGEVASIVRREPEHMLKYMAKELASQGLLEGRTAVFSGKFGMMQVESKFTQYLNTFVLCHECKKPDTKILREDRLAFLKCEACGAKKPVPVVK